MRALLIPTEGEPKVVEQNGLHDLQALVGGFIELVPLRVHLPESITAYCDEGGLLKGREINPRACALSESPIVGDVVVVGFDRASGEDAPLPDDAFDLLGVPS